MPSDNTTTICLVRHGETDWNLTHRYQGWEDIPLNGTGLAQADLVARAVAGESWDAIVSSPLSRAMQTAQAIATASGFTEIVPEPDLRERGYGEAEGMTLAEREAIWSGADWPGLEPYEVMAQRSMAALERIARTYQGQRVLVACHGGVINAVLAAISNGEVGSGVTIILNTARSVLLRTPAGWSIDSVTDASHLELAYR